MKRVVLALFVCLLFAASASAQQCELNLEQAPRLRGFKLGMSVAQARAKLPGVTFPKPDDNGDLSLFLRGPALRKSDPSASEDVSNGLFTFFDGRLVSLTIGYADSVKWESVDEFAFSVSQSLGLPPVWPRRAAQSDDSGYSETYISERNLMCQGFMVSVRLNKFSRSPVSLNLMDTSYPELLSERIREVKERKKARFKP
jgi:hypothetical protein